MVALDRSAEKVNLLVSSGVNNKVHEPALDLGPLVAHLPR